MVPLTRDRVMQEVCVSEWAKRGGRSGGVGVPLSVLHIVAIALTLTFCHTRRLQFECDTSLERTLLAA